MDEPAWVETRDAIAIHDLQLAEHGGLPGFKDESLLESAMARPKQLYAYGEPDLFDLGASYAFGIAKNHAFIDGNKRTSLNVCLAFLDINGFGLPVADEENISTWEALAAGILSEAELAIWLRARVRNVINRISGEGESVQIELVENVPVPTIEADGWELEEIIGNVLYLRVVKEHVRDDGEVIRDTVGRISMTTAIFFEMKKMIDDTSDQEKPQD